MKQHEELHNDFIENQEKISQYNSITQVKIDTLVKSNYEIKVNITQKKNN
jgi:hypothetical protein